MATTTPEYGWPVPTSTDYVKDGATAIEALGDAVDATLYTALGGDYPGLRLVKKQTIGTAVSSVTVTGAFSATYDNYLLLMSGGAASAGSNTQLKIGSATANYNSANVGLTYAGAASNLNSASATNFPSVGVTSPTIFRLHVNIESPFLAKNTMISYHLLGSGNMQFGGGALLDTTSHTDFTLSPTAQTWTGGTIYVYGYGAS